MSNPKLNQRLHEKAIRPVKILQFGEGNFLRAFADWMVHILNRQTDFNGNVTVVQPLQNGMVSLLNQQEGLYTVMLKGLKEGKPAQEKYLIDSIEKGIDPYQDFEEFIKEAENEQLKIIISNTTESGIVFVPEDMPANKAANSFPGKLLQLLFHRFKTFKGSPEAGLFFLPCELIAENGKTLEHVLSKLAAHWQLPQDFQSWLTAYNHYCNTLVDRIVPGFPKDKFAEICNELGYEDQMVVEGEIFHLWVIESNNNQALKKLFPVAETDLNVVFTQDLTPYRSRKVRILNGAHTAMVPVAYLLGIDTVRETLENPNTSLFVKDAIFNEIIPTLQLPEEELIVFAQEVIDRFKNPFTEHQLISISLNSISKYQTRVLPSLVDFQKQKGYLPKRLVFALAALLLFYKGTRHGQKIPLNDAPEVLDFFEENWNLVTNGQISLEEMVLKCLKMQDYWQQDLSLIPNLAEELYYWLSRMENEGMDAALRSLA